MLLRTAHLGRKKRHNTYLITVSGPTASSGGLRTVKKKCDGAAGQYTGKLARLSQTAHRHMFVQGTGHMPGTRIEPPGLILQCTLDRCVLTLRLEQGRRDCLESTF